MILGRELLDYLRGPERASLTVEIAQWVIASRGIEITSAKHLQHLVNRVWRVLTVLRDRGLVTWRVGG